MSLTPVIRSLFAGAVALLLLVGAARAAPAPAPPPGLAVGDLVFIRVGARPFLEVAAATGSWTNHVGIVVSVDGPEPEIAEATLPWSRRGGWQRFVERSQGGRVAVRRLAEPLTPEQATAVVAAAQRRLGVRYDTGFDLHSRGQFCSRFVHEVLLEATGTAVGRVQTFAELLQAQPQAGLGFWRLWYFGRIPWERRTVTPASVLDDAALVPVFDSAAPGYAWSGWMSTATRMRETML